MVGVDLDRYNISQALVPGADTVRLTLGTGSDQIALALSVLNFDIFEPILNMDSQIRVLSGGDEHLCAVDNISISIFESLGFLTRRVRTCPRFRKGK